MLPLSIANAGQMLSVTAVTLDDQLQLAFLAIPDAVPKVDKLARYTQEAFDGLADSLLAPVIVKSQRKLVAHDRTLASTQPAPRLKSIARGSVLKRATARCVSRRQGRE